MRSALTALLASAAALKASASTDRPIIGVLALPVDHSDCITLTEQDGSPVPSGSTSCFHTVYVKWLESAGARVAPIPFDLPEAEFDKLVSSLNGAVITGGEADIKDLSSGYMKATSKLYQHALTLAKGGETWPLWGTCMGMQVLSILGADDPSVLLSRAYDSEGLLLPLDLTPAAADSALLCDSCLDATTRATLTSLNVTVNLHHDGVPPSAWTPGSKLAAAFALLSTNVDGQGKAFASTIEATGGAKIFGTQWHPERPQFDWSTEHAIPMHSPPAVSAMFAVGARLVHFARANARAFPDAASEAAALIYNYMPAGTSSYQAYYFADTPTPTATPTPTPTPMAKAVEEPGGVSFALGSAAVPRTPSSRSPTAAACPITANTSVVIYHGNGATAECRQWEHDFYQWMGIEAVALTAAQLQSPLCGGRLRSHGVKIFAMPGGNAYDEQTSVGAVGKKNLLSFIDGGGLYVGTCAGYYFAATGYFWQVGETGGGEFHWPNTLGRFPEVEGSITTIQDDAVAPGYKLTGYTTSNGTAGHGIYWGGPTFGWRSTAGTDYPGEVLARFADVSQGKLPAAVRVSGPGNNLLLFSVHLEAEEGVGISNTGLTRAQTLQNWRYRATQIAAAAGLSTPVPASLPPPPRARAALVVEAAPSRHGAGPPAAVPAAAAAAA